MTRVWPCMMTIGSYLGKPLATALRHFRFFFDPTRFLTQVQFHPVLILILHSDPRHRQSVVAEGGMEAVGFDPFCVQNLTLIPTFCDSAFCHSHLQTVSILKNIGSFIKRNLNIAFANEILITFFCK